MKACLKISLVLLILIAAIVNYLPTAKAAAAGHLVINEVYYDAATGNTEWIELYNPTDSILALNNFSLTDLESSFIFPENSEILPKDYVVIAQSSLLFENQYKIKPDFEWKGMSLNNDGDEIIFRDSSKIDIDAVVYEKGSYGAILPHNGAGKGSSIERQPKGIDSGDCRTDFIEQNQPSPYFGLPTRIDLKIEAIGQHEIKLNWQKSADDDFLSFALFLSLNGADYFLVDEFCDANYSSHLIDNLKSGSLYFIRLRHNNLEGGFCDSVISATTKAVYSDKIFINELLARPSGGTDFEYIELYNNSSQPVDLSGWYLDDEDDGSAKYQIPNGTIINPFSFLVFYKKDTAIALNDIGDEARLFFPSGELASKSERYTEAGVDISWSMDAQGAWKYSTTLTPDKVNVITLPQSDEDDSLEIVPISEAKNKAKNSWVKIGGVITAIPGLFGAKVIYIQDESGGIKIYFSSAQWPRLHLGDKVIIIGKISLSAGEHQLRIYDSSAIIILGENMSIKAEKKKINQLEQAVGMVVRVSGRVIKSSGSTFWLDDGSGIIRIYLYPGTNISGLGLKKGDFVTLSGIVSTTASGLRLLPINRNDIKIAKGISSSQGEKMVESVLSEIMGVDSAMAASDYRVLSVNQTNNSSKIAGISLLILGLILLVFLHIFANIHKSKANS